MNDKITPPALPLTREDLRGMLCNAYGESCFEPNPAPFELWLEEASSVGRDVGLQYIAGEFETYAGACLEAYLAGRPGRVVHKPVRFKSSVPNYRAPTIDPAVAADIKRISRAILAQRNKEA